MAKKSGSKSKPIAHSVNPDNSPMALLDMLELAVMKEPSHLGLLQQAFELSVRLQAWDRAQFHVKHLQAISDNRLAWIITEGDLLISQERYAEARQFLWNIPLDNAPFAALDIIQHNLAYCELYLGEYRICRDRCQPYLNRHEEQRSIDPETLEGLQAMGLTAMHHLDELDEAWQHVEQLHQRGPLAPRMSNVASLIALDRDDFKTSEILAQSAIQAANRSFRPLEAYISMAAVKLFQQEPDAAKTMLDKALSIRPNDSRSLSLLGFTHLMSLGLDDAIQCFQQSLTPNFQHLGTYHGLAWAFILRQDWSVAQKTFEAALAIDDNFAESHGGRALVLLAQGDREQAKEAIRRAKGLDPESVTAQFAENLLDTSLEKLKLQDFVGQIMAKVGLRSKN